VKFAAKKKGHFIALSSCRYSFKTDAAKICLFEPTACRDEIRPY
jgi:hypothetical protein